MKTHYLLKVLLLNMLFFYTCSSLSAQYLYIQPEGKEQVLFELAQKPKITFKSRSLVIETPSTQSVFSLGEIQGLSFGQTVVNIPSLLNQGNKIRLYPNPVKDEFRFYIQISTEGLRYRIYDLVGILLQTDGVDASATVDIRNYRPGFYILRLDRNGQEIQSFKIVKQ